MTGISISGEFLGGVLYTIKKTGLSNGELFFIFV